MSDAPTPDHEELHPHSQIKKKAATKIEEANAELTSFKALIARTDEATGAEMGQLIGQIAELETQVEETKEAQRVSEEALNGNAMRSSHPDPSPSHTPMRYPNSSPTMLTSSSLTPLAQPQC